MSTVRVRWQPTGLINGRPWPKAGETLDLDNEAAVDGMVEAGVVERVEPEKPAKDPEDPAKREQPERAVSRRKPQQRRGRQQRSE